MKDPVKKNADRHLIKVRNGKGIIPASRSEIELLAIALDTPEKAHNFLSALRAL